MQQNKRFTDANITCLYHLQSVIVNPTFYVGDIFKHPQILLGILKKISSE